MPENIKYKTAMYDFRKFIIQFLVLFILIWVIDFALGKTLKYFYFKQKSGIDYRTTYSLEKTKADILIFGSSRGARQYYPDVFENNLHLTYYNVSREGFFMFYHDAVLRSVLKRYSPKIAILDFRLAEFKKNKENYERLSSLLPYYDTHPEIRPVLDARSKYEKLKLLSNIYPFNSLMFTIVGGNTELKKDKQQTIEGYIPNDRIWDKPLDTVTITNQYMIDSNVVKSYEDFIQRCLASKVKLFVVVSPYFSIINKHDPSITLAKEIAAKYNVRFIDYSQEKSLLSRPELFADPIHLNNNGARVMSKMLTDSILKNYPVVQ